MKPKADQCRAAINARQVNMPAVAGCHGASWWQVGPTNAKRWYDEGYPSVDQILDEMEAATRTHGDPRRCAFVEKCRPTDEQWMGLLYFK
jgi:hypothetical protein